MSGALNISTCRRDSGSGTAHIHFPELIEGRQSNIETYSNRGTMIWTIDDEVFCKCDILLVCSPEE